VTRSQQKKNELDKALNHQKSLEKIKRLGPKIYKNKETMNGKPKDQSSQTNVDFELLEKLVQNTHEQFMHLGQKRLRMVLSLLFPLHHFGNELLQKVCKDCRICTTRQKLASKSSIGRMLLPQRPNEILHIDHVTPFPNVTSINKKITILSIKDSFTKFVSLVPCRGYQHVEIVDALRSYFGTHGIPAIIKMDNALTSSELENFCKSFGVKVSPVPIYRPQSNGQVERVHRDLRRYIMDTLTALDLPKTRWCRAIPTVMNIINATPHSVTGYAPEELQLGRNTADFNPHLKKELQDKYRRVKIKLEQAQDRSVKESAGPYPSTLLNKGDCIWIQIDNKEPIKAIVLKDFGNICLVKKLDAGRFQVVQVHKSLISLRIDDESKR